MIELVNSIDIAIIEYIQNNLHNPIMDKVMIFITGLGNAGFIWIAIALGLLINKKYRKVGIALLFALTLGAIIGNGILKNIIARDRPFINIEGINLLIKAPTAYSFPSGHTTSSFAAALVLSMNFKDKALYMYILAILIAFSRVYLGVHFLTDIIAGIILGSACGYVSIFLLRKIKEDNKYKDITNG